MFLKIRQRMAQDESGFTLVELLVVMLILGLLAAIAIPAFFSQRDKASDADAKSSVRTAETAAETIATDNDGQYDGAAGVTVANLEAVEETLNDANLSVVGAPTDDTYTVRVTSDTNNTFDITRNADGTTDLTCGGGGDPLPDGGCPADGTWD